jgi:hypothetical protein
MATIPLPALHVNTEQPSPLALYAQLQQIRNAQSQNQTQQLQQTALSQENQQRALQLQDAQTLRSLAPNHVTKDADGNVTGFDTQGLIKEAASKGVNPATLNQMQNQYAESVKNLAAASEATRNNEIAKNKAAYEVLEGVRSADPAQRASVLQQALPNLQKLGVDTTKLAQPGLPLDDKSLDSFEAGLGMHQQSLTDAKTQAETDKAKQDAIKAIQETSASKATEEHTRMLTAQGGPVDQRVMADWLAKNPGKSPADFAKWHASLNPMAQIMAQFGTGGAKAPLSDTVIDALAAPGAKLKLADVIPMRAPLAVKQAAVNQILEKYPNYSTADYDIEKGVMKSATSGAIAMNLTNFNTAIEHAKQLQEDANALDNANLQTYNKIGNRLNVELGKDAVTNFNVVKNALAGEMSKVFKGGQATDAEIKAVEQPFNAANSPEQLKGAIASAIRLMNSKRDALKQQVEQGRQGKANFGNEAPTGKIPSPAEWLEQQKKKP